MLRAGFADPTLAFEVGGWEEEGDGAGGFFEECWWEDFAINRLVEGGKLVGYLITHGTVAFLKKRYTRNSWPGSPDVPVTAMAVSLQKRREMEDLELFLCAIYGERQMIMETFRPGNIKAADFLEAETIKPQWKRWRIRRKILGTGKTSTKVLLKCLSGIPVVNRDKQPDAQNHLNSMDGRPRPSTVLVEVRNQRGSSQMGIRLDAVGQVHEILVGLDIKPVGLDHYALIHVVLQERVGGFGRVLGR